MLCGYVVCIYAYLYICKLPCINKCAPLFVLSDW